MFSRLMLVIAAFLASSAPLPKTTLPPTMVAAWVQTAVPPGRSEEGSPQQSAPLQATAVTTTTLKAIPSPSIMDEMVALEATVTDDLEGFSPTGVVTLYGDGVLLGDEFISIDNWTRLYISPLSVGTHVFTATYGGDGTFAPSQSTTLTHTVQRSGVRLRINEERSFRVIFGFEIVPEAGVPVLDGSVTVSDGISSCTALVSEGQCSIMFSAAGPHRLTAVYTGSAQLESPVSAPLDITVRRYWTVMRADVTPPWVDAGQPVTVTVMLMPGSTEAPAYPTGSVTVSMGATIFCSGAVSVCSFVPTTFDQIHIVYSGDSVFEPNSVSLSSPLRAATTLNMRAEPNPVVAGAPLTLTASVSGGPSCSVPNYVLCAPGGSVVYYDDGAELGRAMIHPRIGFVFPISVRLTKPGTHTLTAFYSGDLGHVPSHSEPLTVVVLPQPIYLPLVQRGTDR